MECEHKKYSSFNHQLNKTISTNHMKKHTLLLALLALSFSLVFVACSSEDEPDTKETETETETETGEKTSVTTIKFAANGKDCGITDGFANQQHTLPHLVHINTDKCNGETFRPTLTLNFQADKTIVPGTYTIAAKDNIGEKGFVIESIQYNYTSWDGTAGSVVVTTNEEDATKIDIELKSITMTNRTADDKKNPATDILTGYIIKI